VASEGLDVIDLTSQEAALCATLPDTRGTGEREGIAVCQARGGVLLSNEWRVTHVCRERGIACLRIPGILRALWREGLVPRDEVWRILGDLETRDRMRLKQSTVDAIFADDPAGAQILNPHIQPVCPAALTRLK